MRWEARLGRRVAYVYSELRYVIIGRDHTEISKKKKKKTSTFLPHTSYPHSVSVVGRAPHNPQTEANDGASPVWIRNDGGEASSQSARAMEGGTRLSAATHECCS